MILKSNTTKNAQNESTHQQGLALPNRTIETSAHFAHDAQMFDLFGPFISEVQVR